MKRQVKIWLPVDAEDDISARLDDDRPGEISPSGSIISSAPNARRPAITYHAFADELFWAATENGHSPLPHAQRQAELADTIRHGRLQVSRAGHVAFTATAARAVLAMRCCSHFAITPHAASRQSFHHCTPLIAFLSRMRKI